MTMKWVLDPLVATPGVRLALLATQDGVPIAWRGNLRGPGDARDAEELAGIAALAAGWIEELGASVGAMTWTAPDRIEMCASGALMIAARARGALLLVVAERGVAPEDLCLPVDAAVARLERGSDRAHAPAPAPRRDLDNAPGLLPSHPQDPAAGVGPVRTTPSGATRAPTN